MHGRLLHRERPLTTTLQIQGERPGETLACARPTNSRVVLMSGRPETPLLPRCIRVDVDDATEGTAEISSTCEQDNGAKFMHVHTHTVHMLVSPQNSWLRPWL